MDDFDFEIDETGGTDSNSKLEKNSKNDNKNKKDKKSKKDKKNKKDKKAKDSNKKEKKVKNHKENDSDNAQSLEKIEDIQQEDVHDEEKIQEAKPVVGVLSQVSNSNINTDFEEDDEFEIIEEDEEHIRKKSNQRKQKMVRLVILAIIVLAVCSVGCFTFILKRAELDKFESILLDSQYDKAKTIYGNLMDSQRTTADTMIITKTTSIYGKYYKGGIDSKKAIEELKKLDKVSVNDIKEIDEMLALFDKILVSEKVYKQAQDTYEKGNLINAIKLFRKVIKEDAHYKKAQVGIKKAGSEYRKSCVEEAEKYAEEEDYDGAIKIMEKSMVVLVDDEQAMKQLQTYKSAKLSLEISDITDTVNVAVKNKKYVNAIKIVKDAIDVYGEDIRLTDMFASLQEDMYKEVNTYIESERYTVAVSILKSYVRIIDDDEKATDLIEKYSSKVDAGKFVANLKYSSEEGKSYKITDVADYKDAQGNRYESVIEVVGYKNLDKKGNIEFSNVKFKTLSGVIGYISDDEVNYYKTGKGIVRIYGDGKEIFKSKTVEIDSESQEISVDIAKYKTIKIAWEAADSKNAEPYGIVLGDFKVN